MSPVGFELQISARLNVQFTYPSGDILPRSSAEAGFAEDLPLQEAMHVHDGFVMSVARRGLCGERRVSSSLRKLMKPLCLN